MSQAAPVDDIGGAPEGAGRYHRRAFSLILFLAIASAVWLILWQLYERFPLTRPGAEVVAAAKFDRLTKSKMFAPTDRVRLLVFGDSKTLAGFRPEIFDAAIGKGVRSYNLGLPGQTHFLPILKAALAAGNVPTHVALTIAWDDVAMPPRPFSFLLDDATLVHEIVPFRDLLRNLTVFAADSRLHLRAKYQDAAEQTQLMLSQRGWYFIKSQSHFPGDMLPVDYAIPTDQPGKRAPRLLPNQSLARSELEQLARRYGFKILLVPANMRHGAQAAMPESDIRRQETISASPVITIVGPDYLVYPAPRYADPVHLNPAGAAIYTLDLAHIITQSGVLK